MIRCARFSFNQIQNFIIMANAYLFNTSSMAIKVSINNGPFFEIPAANASSWRPAAPNQPIPFVANPAPAPGQIGLGSNMITFYPSMEGPARSSNFTLSIPSNTPIESLQLYFFRADQGSFACMTNINGGYSAEGSRS